MGALCYLCGYYYMVDQLVGQDHNSASTCEHTLSVVLYWHLLDHSPKVHPRHGPNSSCKHNRVRLQDYIIQSRAFKCNDEGRESLGICLAWYHATYEERAKWVHTLILGIKKVIHNFSAKFWLLEWNRASLI